MSAPAKPVLRNSRQASFLLASPMLAALACVLLWNLLTPGRAMASTPQPPPPPDTPDIFLVDASAAQPAAAGDNEIGIRARLTVGRLADKPAEETYEAYCPPGKNVEAAADDDLFYCYRLENTGNQTLLLHTLVDSRFGEIFSMQVQTVTPGMVAGYYRIGKALVSSTDYMTWTAITDNDEPLTDFSTADVIVPALDLTVTAGLDPATCAASGRLMLERAGTAVFCLQVHNPNDFALKEHRAFDANGVELALPVGLELAPGASTFVTTTALVTTPTFSRFTWTAKSATKSTPLTVTNQVEVRTPHITTALLVTDPVRPNCVTNTLTVTVGSNVLFCYFVINDGSIPLQGHVVTDSQFGKAGDFVRPLPTDGTYGFAITRTLTATTETGVLWRATGAGDIVVEAAASASVFVVEPARLSVRVFVNDGTPPSGSNGLPGIVVELTAPATATQRKTSDEFGTATFLNLIPGEYKVEVVDTSAMEGVAPLTGAITTATVIEGAVVSVQFPFTGTAPTRYQHLPLIRR